MRLRPLRLLPSFREKLWGTTALAPWFVPPPEKIGEVWFGFDENETSCGRTLIELMRESGPALLGTRIDPALSPILVKFIFTADRLSIQVHPDDGYAGRHEGSWGKTEMWYVLRAEPGARLALGFREAITRERLRQAALSGEIEELVRWIPVQAGDTYFTPPGTVHAIGPGLVLCEIQQNCDLTYRIYDYGRPRELHLDKAADVANLGPHPGCSVPVDLGEGRKLLAACKYFATELIEPAGSLCYEPDSARFHLLLFLEGRGALAGEPFRAGECWLVPASAAPFDLDAAARVRLLRIYVP